MHVYMYGSKYEDIEAMSRFSKKVRMSAMKGILKMTVECACRSDRQDIDIE